MALKAGTAPKSNPSMDVRSIRSAIEELSTEKSLQSRKSTTPKTSYGAGAGAGADELDLAHHGLPPPGSSSSSKRIIAPPPATVPRNKSAPEIDAILARKISSTDLASPRERPFVANKVIRPPPTSGAALAYSAPQGAAKTTKDTATEARPKQRIEQSNGPGGGGGGGNGGGKDDGLTLWRDVGDAEVLRKSKCRRIYAKGNQDKDLALFYKGGTFYALEAWCSHMGGPLYQGDIEEYKGKCHVMCPWHAYMFDLETGHSEIGLQQKVFPVRVEDGKLQIQYDSQLAIYPFL